MSKTIDINVLALHIRTQLHTGTCPGQGAKGELAYIMPAANGGSWDAWMYAWSDELKSAEIAEWFSGFGCTGVLVFQQMHDEDNEIVDGRSTLDNVRPFLVMFHAETDETPAPHPDDVAVDGFTQFMKAKMELKRHQGRGGWDDKLQCSQAFLTQLLREHVEKGDPVDVANFCMMLSARGEKILPATATGLTAQADDPAAGFEMWWAEYMPEATQAQAFKAWTAPQAQADVRDAESDYQRGYRHGYNRRDIEVQGALL